jgi:hypothetical protein
MSPVKYKLGFYIPEDTILHSHCRKSLKSYLVSQSWYWCELTLLQPSNDVMVLLAGHL